MDFSKKSLTYTRFSMPTKVSEYMSSGTPILVSADESTSLYKYASEQKWAYVLNNNNVQNMADAIEKLYHDEALRKALGTVAIIVVQKNHDVKTVREKFAQTIIDSIKK
jgi:glycosyltransferase involved in cell wall biosynthesis